MLGWHRRRGGRPRVVVAVAGLVLVLLSSCGLVPLGTSRPPSSPSSPGPAAVSPAAPTAAPTGTGAATPATAGRPVLPVPDVRPAGFATPPPGAGMRRYLDQTITWSDCGENLQCTSVSAPLDYDEPDTESITLALARRPASAKPRIGSLFINPGGPGGSGTDYVGYFAAEGLGRYDIVGWDPRGTGGSTPVRCANGKAMDSYVSLDATPDDAGEEATLEQGQREFGRSCLERSGALLEHISTAETVRDLDLLRHLVGDEKLGYFGSSYGTRIGALYAELYPSRVGRMVLDGAVNITSRDDVSQLDGFERALGSFAAWCAERDCRLGDTKAEVQTAVGDLWARLDAEPVDGGRGPLTQQLAVTGVLAVLYENEEAWRYLAEALERAAFDDDGRYLMFFADQYNRRGKDGQYGQLQFSFPAIRCLDSQDVSVDAERAEAAKEAERAPVIGPYAGADLVCPLWPVAPAPKMPTIRGAGSAPIMVIGTTGDPATPYEYAERMADQLDSGTLLTLRGEGHLGYGQSACVQRHVRAYFVDGEVPADGTRC